MSRGGRGRAERLRAPWPDVPYQPPVTDPEVVAWEVKVAQQLLDEHPTWTVLMAVSEAERLARKAARV